jgi:hypothetical protein
MPCWCATRPLGCSSTPCPRRNCTVDFCFLRLDNVTLPNGGAELELVTASGIIVSSVEYNDVGRWPTIADGGGPSLELRCPTADTRDPDNWIASPVAKNSDCYQETTGTPGLVNTLVICPPRKFVKPDVHFTEIFYILSVVKAFVTPPSSSRSGTPAQCRSTSAIGASSPRAA